MSTTVELNNACAERDTYRAQAIRLEARVQELEAECATLRERRQCPTCDGTGTVFPPANFGQPVPDEAAEECADCFGTGLDRHAR